MAEVLLRALAYLILLTPERRQNAMALLARAFREQERGS